MKTRNLTGLDLAQLFLSAFVALCLLVSCGDSDSGNSTSVPQETENDFPECTSANSGKTFTLDSVEYVCKNGKWNEIESTPAKSDSSVADTSKAPHSSNSSEKDSAKVDSLLTDSTDVVDTTKTESADTTEVSSDSGYVMKKGIVLGTVEYGSLDEKSAVVRVEELDDTLSATGVSFDAVYAKGAFSAKDVNLKFPVAKVSAIVKPVNLVNASAAIKADTLYALVDVTGDSAFANVNVFSYLVSVRAEALLAASEKASLTDVMKKASEEVWEAFHFEKTLGAPDSVMTFNGKESGAALLAMTILAQEMGKDGFANLSAIAEDFADGKWDDSVARAKVADWAFNEDIEDEFETIHKNAEKLGGDVPEFEKYIKAFYQAELGIAECTSENAGEVEFVKNPSSAYYAADYSDVSVTLERFVCDANTGAWRVALDREKDTYGFGECSEGDVEQGKVNGGVVYGCNAGSKTWRILTSAAARDAFFVKKSAIKDFEDIQDVYESIKDGERAIFLLRHAERDKDVTSKEGHLTEKGVQESKDVGARLTKFDEPFRLGASEFYRAQQTVISMAQGRGQDTVVADTLAELNDDWYMRDRSLVNQAESAAGGGWEATSLYTYTGAYTEGSEINAYYNLAERSAELIEDVLLAKYEDVPERFVLLSSHDKLMVPFVAYCSDLKINMNVKDGGTWINYLAGIAIIWDKTGNRRYVAFKGLESAYFQGW